MSSANQQIREVFAQEVRKVRKNVEDLLDHEPSGDCSSWLKEFGETFHSISGAAAMVDEQSFSERMKTFESQVTGWIQEENERIEDIPDRSVLESALTVLQEKEQELLSSDTQSD